MAGKRAGKSPGEVSVGGAQGQTSTAAGTSGVTASAQVVTESRAEWNKREKISAKALVTSWKHVGAHLVDVFSAAFPELHPMLEEVWARSWTEEQSKDKEAFFALWPEPLRHVAHCTLTALLMEAENIAAEMKAWPDEKRRQSVSEFADYCNEWMRQWLYGYRSGTMDGEASMGDGPYEEGNGIVLGHSPQVGSRYINEGVVIGLVEYCVAEGPSAGEARPAVLIKLHEDNAATLHVHFAAADAPHEPVSKLQRVPFNKNPEKGTWFHEAIGPAVPVINELEPIAAAEGEATAELAALA